MNVADASKDDTGGNICDPVYGGGAIYTAADWGTGIVDDDVPGGFW